MPPRPLHPAPEQRAILDAHHERHVIVEANAGAAKTTTLALRLAQALDAGVAPERLLALTYTEPAVAALRRALETAGVKAPLRTRVPVHIFDGFCARRLAAIEGPGVQRLTTPEQLRPHVLAALDALRDDPAEPHPQQLTAGAGDAMVEGLLASFMRLKGALTLQLDLDGGPLTPTRADELGHDYATLRAFKAHERLRRGRRPDERPDFRAPGDATYDLALQLLDDDAVFGPLHPLALGLALVAVDEMHDTNRAMFTVLRQLLAHNPQAAFIGVGDRDQVIHSVAGADAAFMGPAFDAEIARPARLPLTLSYRFGPALAAAVGRLARKPYAALPGRATELVLVPCAAPADAERAIVEAVVRRSGLGAKSKPSQIAVLLRRPHQSVGLENRLLDHGVDYRTAGFEPYLMRPEVLFVRGLMALARGEFAAIESPETRRRIGHALLLFCGAPLDAALAEEAVAELAEVPSRIGWFFDNRLLPGASDEVRGRIADALDVVRGNTTQTLLDRFAQALAPRRLAARALVRAGDVEQVEANIAGLIRSAAGYDDVASFFRAMNERELRQRAMAGRDCVLLASIEAVKGLEFEHVLLPGLSQREFSGAAGDDIDNRNLLYVAMTRAKNRLTVLYDPARPSRYLADAGLVG